VKLRPLLASASIVLFPGTARSYLEAARTATTGTTLYFSYLCELADIRDLRDAATLAIWPGSRWVATSSSVVSAPARATFLQTYTDRAGAPPTSVAASAYDALALLSNAAADGINPTGVRDRMESRTFVGVATTYTFSVSQHAGFNTGDLALLRYVSASAAPALR
jgi:hypothetical protein